MPTAVLPLAADSAPKRKRFTRTEVYRLLNSGFFDGQRFELIDGDLIDKMGQNPPHAETLRRLNEWLAGIFGSRLVQMQLPIEAGPDDRETSEPEPDVIVLAEKKAEYSRRHPRGHETLLIVEVADTSLRQDTVRKRELYARAGVPEYWVVNVNDRELIVHTDLRDGRYHEVRTLSEGGMVSLGSRPDVSVPVDQLLP